jgi:hypothetical protein
LYFCIASSLCPASWLIAVQNEQSYLRSKIEVVAQNLLSGLASHFLDQPAENVGVDGAVAEVGAGTGVTMSGRVAVMVSLLSVAAALVPPACASAVVPTVAAIRGLDEISA